MGGGGAVAHYGLQVVNGSEESEVQLFLNYPRWSEPVLGFVARALAAVAADPALADDDAGDSATCAAVLVPRGVGTPRPLASVSLARYPKGWQLAHVEGDGKPKRRLFTSRIDAPLALLIEALCRVVWLESTLPPVPEPLAIPIRTHGHVSYVRTDDLPPWVRPVFEQYRLARVSRRFRVNPMSRTRTTGASSWAKRRT